MLHRVPAGLLLSALFMAGCSSPSADELYAKGNDYLRQDLVAEAVVQYRLAVQADSKRGDIRAKLSEAYLRQRDGSSALREAVNAADLLPNDAGAQIRAGNLLLLAGGFEDARGRAEKALAIEQDNVDALVLMGNARAGLKDFDGAMADYQEALVLNPGAESVYANIGAIQFQRGHSEEAETTFKRAVELAPRSISARMGLSSFLWASGRTTEAEASLKEALALDPANLGTNRALGLFYLATNRAAEAEPFFKTIADATKSDVSQLALADYYLTMGRTEDAKTILSSLRESTESFGPASLRLAAIEAGQNNPTGAAAIVDQVLARTPRYAPARLFKVRLLLASQKVDEAMQEAQALVASEPGSTVAADAELVVGAIEAARDRPEQALAAYEDALRIRPQSIETALALAQLHLRMGHPDQVQTYARQVLSSRADNPAARALIVRAYLLQNDVERASTELASLERAFPDAVPVLNLRAARDMAAGRLEAARATYTRVATRAPQNLEALEGLVAIDIKTGHAKEAVARVDEALKRMALSVDLAVLAARAHASAGDFDRSEELLKNAIEREPARLAAYSLLGQLYLSQNRLSDARDQFQQLLARNPASVSASTMLGMLLEAQREVPGAEEQYQKTLAIDPDAAVAANNLAWIYVAANRNLDQALQLAQTAARRLPDEPHVNDTLGWIYYRKGQFEQAVRHLELSVARDQSDPAVFYHLGMAYVRAGSPERGRQALERALSMSASFEGAEEARETLKRLKANTAPKVLPKADFPDHDGSEMTAQTVVLE